MKIFSCAHYALPLPAGHRFPMEKYTRLHERVAATRLGELLVPEPASDVEILRVHTADYFERFRDGRLTAAEQKRIGFPWSAALVERARRSAGATIQACRAALTEGVAVNLAGGTHHAFADAGEGYCCLNDSAVAARAMQAEERVHRVLILDADVHQGNGTAAIFRDDASVFTFSIHGAKNFPLRKEESDLDVELPDGACDDVYLAALQNGVEEALRRAGAELVIYLAGADPFEGDRLGRLKVSKAGLAARDRFVLTRCGTLGLPVAVSMAGGYASHIEDIVDIHLETVRLASCLAR